MKRFILGVIVLVAGLVAMPFTVNAQTEEMPVTFYAAFGGTAALDDEAAIKSASVSLRFGIKTNLNSEGSWRLITEFNSINRPLKKDETSGDFVKSIDLGAERLYWLKPKTGFWSNTAIVLRGVIDIEVNRENNDENLGLGFGILKKLSVDADGNSHFSMQLGLDMLMRDAEEDDIGFYLTMNFTPFQSIL